LFLGQTRALSRSYKRRQAQLESLRLQKCIVVKKLFASGCAFPKGNQLTIF